MVGPVAEVWTFVAEIIWKWSLDLPSVGFADSMNIGFRIPAVGS